jgi:hypothetical protein
MPTDPNRPQEGKRKRIDYQCARCGSSVTFEECWQCGGEGLFGHECGEDCCCCADQSDNERCDICGGSGTIPHCLSSPEWCEAHPLPERETVKRSTVEEFAY